MYDIMEENESYQIDCSRGVIVTRDGEGAPEFTYREGCCKLKDH